jgi:uncharacterized protein YndB with AHSA1/START domain
MAESDEPVVREIDIDASPATIFEFFVDADKLTRWLAVEATLDPRPGGVCDQVHAGDEPGQGPWHMRGSYLEIEPPTRVVFTWGFVEPEIGVPAGSGTVEVTLQPVDGGSRVRLVHRGLPAAEVEGHSKGWAEMLGRLADATTAQSADGPN